MTLIESMLLFTMCVPISASANGLPTHWNEGPSPMIVADSDSGIEVLSEELTYDFRPSAAAGDAPLVTAHYRMKNLKSEEKKTKVLFLYLTQATNMQVLWNGQEVPYSEPEYIDLMKLNLWNHPMGFYSYSGYEMHWLDFDSGEVKTVKRVQPGSVNTVWFPILLKADGEGDLVVRYHQSKSSCEYCLSTWRRGEHYTYLLSPASYWATFHDLTIKVLVPEEYQIATEPALQTEVIENGAKMLSQHFDSLPKGEFHLSVKKPVPLLTLFYAFKPGIGFLVYLVAILAIITRLYKRKFAY
jgi:hypothetical protein